MSQIVYLGPCFYFMQYRKKLLKMSKRYQFFDIKQKISGKKLR